MKNTSQVRGGSKVTEADGNPAIVYAIYSDTHVSLCLEDEDGEIYEDVERDEQTDITTLTLIKY